MSFICVIQAAASWQALIVALQESTLGCGPTCDAKSTTKFDHTRICSRDACLTGRCMYLTIFFMFFLCSFLSLLTGIYCLLHVRIIWVWNSEMGDLDTSLTYVSNHLPAPFSGAEPKLHAKHQLCWQNLGLMYMWSHFHTPCPEKLLRMHIQQTIPGSLKGTLLQK